MTHKADHPAGESMIDYIIRTSGGGGGQTPITEEAPPVKYWTGAPADGRPYGTYVTDASGQPIGDPIGNPQAPSTTNVTVQSGTGSAALTLDDIKREVEAGGGTLTNRGGVYVASFPDGSSVQYDPMGVRGGTVQYNAIYKAAGTSGRKPTLLETQLQGLGGVTKALAGAGGTAAPQADVTTAAAPTQPPPPPGGLTHEAGVLPGGGFLMKTRADEFGNVAKYDPFSGGLQSVDIPSMGLGLTPAQMQPILSAYGYDPRKLSPEQSVGTAAAIQAKRETMLREPGADLNSVNAFIKSLTPLELRQQLEPVEMAAGGVGFAGGGGGFGGPRGVLGQLLAELQAMQGPAVAQDTAETDPMRDPRYWSLKRNYSPMTGLWGTAYRPGFRPPDTTTNYAQGGAFMTDEPIVMQGLYSGQPKAIAGEAGQPERIDVTPTWGGQGNWQDPMMGQPMVQTRGRPRPLIDPMMALMRTRR